MKSNSGCNDHGCLNPLLFFGSSLGLGPRQLVKWERAWAHHFPPSSIVHNICWSSCWEHRKPTHGWVGPEVILFVCQGYFSLVKATLGESIPQTEKFGMNPNRTSKHLVMQFLFLLLNFWGHLVQRVKFFQLTDLVFPGISWPIHLQCRPWARRSSTRCWPWTCNLAPRWTWVQLEQPWTKSSVDNL